MRSALLALSATMAVGCSSPTTPTPSTESSGSERPDVTLPAFESAALDVVLPVVCDFERYNGLRIKRDATETNPAGYEQSLDVFVRLVLGDRSLPTDAASVEQIEAEQARCDALPSLTFANGSHPVGAQIEATTFRSLVPVRQACSWERRDADGEVVDDVSVDAGSSVEIVVEPTDRSIRINGCGIFVAGTPPTER